MYRVEVRTTIDLPDDLHALARELAHQQNRTLSDVITELVRLGLRGESAAMPSGRRGLPQVSVGRPVTNEDVRSLDDEE